MSSRTISPAELLGAIADSMSLLLDPENFDSAMHEALRRIGLAAQADRMYVFGVHPSPDRSELLMSQHYEWAAADVRPQIANPDLQNLSFDIIPLLLVRLNSAEPYFAIVREMDEAPRQLMEAQDIRSFAITPIFLRSELWGFVGWDDCQTERAWTEEELQCLKVAAAGVGGSIVRRQIDSSFRQQADELRRHQRVALSLAEDARMAEQAAAQANLAKTTFLAMMSHEIRTPLNGVIGFTELLLAEGLPDRQVDLAQSIKTCGETLLELISDILDISKIESGKLEFAPFDADVSDCARSTLQSFEPATNKKGIVLHLEVDPTVPQWLWLDLNRFRQVLFNLVGNAVKFTNHGRIDVRLWAEKNEERRIRLHVSVQDTGPGIDAREIQSIFEPFRQGERATTSAVGGSGLGLAICRRLVEGMGGQIEASSSPGHGSQFRFYIATQQGKPAASSSEAVVETAETTAEVRLLVVDDVPTNVRLAVSMLSRLGYQADSAASGMQAIEMARDKPYDVILMDVFMPELNGFGTTREIRSHQRAFRQPLSWIIALTADALPENRQRCAEAGMEDFLTKPLRLKELEAALGRWRSKSPVLHD